MKASYATHKRPYNIFMCLKQRCNNPKNKDYKYYGGRGIQCHWRTFQEFWGDMRHSYHYKLTIDRIDVNKGYSGDNCRWIPNRQQPKNRRPASEWVFKNKIHNHVKKENRNTK